MVDKSNDVKIDILPYDYQQYDKLFKVIVIGDSGINILLIQRSWEILSVFKGI